MISADKPCTAEISFEVFQDNTTVGAEFIISDDFQKLSLFHSYLRNGLAPVFAKGVHRMTCEIAPLPLTTGSYPVTLGLSRPVVPIDYLENAATIEVALPHRDGMMEEYKRASGNGCVFVEHKWRVG